MIIASESITEMIDSSDTVPVSLQRSDGRSNIKHRVMEEETGVFHLCYRPDALEDRKHWLNEMDGDIWTVHRLMRSWMLQWSRSSVSNLKVYNDVSVSPSC